jgi:hypothetical protein
MCGFLKCDNHVVRWMAGITSVLNMEVVHFCVGRGLCDKLITHPEESYHLWCIVVCDLETS